MKKRNILVIATLVLVIAVIIAAVSVAKAIGEAQLPTNVLPTAIRHAGSTAECKDGIYSYSKSRSGTCADHGGVKQWVD